MGHTMNGLYADTEECDGPTLSRGAGEDATVAGAAATVHFHHLHALLSALGPLRATYVAAAADPLRALPFDAKRAILPHLLREHPALALDPRIRALADDVLLDTDAAADRPDVVRWLARIAGVRAGNAHDALDRVERALVGLASGVAELARSRAELLATLAAHTRGARADDPAPPDDAAELLAWCLRTHAHDDGSTPAIAASMAALVRHSTAVSSAARDAALALVAPSNVGRPSSWWARSTRGVGNWIGALATRGDISHDARFESAFARAYFARTREGS